MLSTKYGRLFPLSIFIVIVSIFGINLISYDSVINYFLFKNYLRTPEINSFGPYFFGHIYLVLSLVKLHALSWYSIILFTYNLLLSILVFYKVTRHQTKFANTITLAVFLAAFVCFETYTSTAMLFVYAGILFFIENKSSINWKKLLGLSLLMAGCFVRYEAAILALIIILSFRRLNFRNIAPLGLVALFSIFMMLGSFSEEIQKASNLNYLVHDSPIKETLDCKGISEPEKAALMAGFHVDYIDYFNCYKDVSNPRFDFSKKNNLNFNFLTSSLNSYFNDKPIILCLFLFILVLFLFKTLRLTPFFIVILIVLWLVFMGKFVDHVIFPMLWIMLIEVIHDFNEKRILKRSFYSVLTIVCIVLSMNYLFLNSKEIRNDHLKQIAKIENEITGQNVLVLGDGMSLFTHLKPSDFKSLTNNYIMYDNLVTASKSYQEFLINDYGGIKSKDVFEKTMYVYSSSERLTIVSNYLLAKNQFALKSEELIHGDNSLFIIEKE